MKYIQVIWEDLSVEIGLSCFKPEQSIGEYHAMIELTDTLLRAEEQFERIDKAIERLIQSEVLNNAGLVWKRYFVSDAINQAGFMKMTSEEAVSIVQQPPLNGSKLSVWLYFVEGASLSRQANNTVVLKRPSYTHLFHTQMHGRIGDVNQQTDSVFGYYTQSLTQNNCSLEAHCIRTWIFVQDVDIQYMGMVNSRRHYFMEAGLTPATHYIASTGIEGRYIYPEVLMLMDAYAIPEIKKEQIQYLQALTHLNPTFEYGVTFERGTLVQYGDRRHIFISGTASINNKGEIVHPLDINRQIERMLENVRILLSEGGADMQDVVQMIIYLRDTADYRCVKKYFDRYFSEIPTVILLAPVCRPGWLIEVECIAVKMADDDRFDPF